MESLSFFYSFYIIAESYLLQVQKYEVPNSNLPASSPVKVPNVKPAATGISPLRTSSPMSVSMPRKASLQTPAKKTPIPVSSLTPASKTPVQNNVSHKPATGAPTTPQKTPAVSSPTQGQAVTLIRSPMALSNTIHGNIVTNSQGISVLRVQTTQQGAVANASGLLQLVASTASGGKERFTVVPATKPTASTVTSSTVSKPVAAGQPTAGSPVTSTSARITSKPQQIVMVMSPVTSNSGEMGKVTFASSQGVSLSQAQKSYTAAGLNQILQLSQQGAALKIVTMASQVSSASAPLQTQAGVKIAQPVRLPNGQVVLQMVATAPTTPVTTSVSAVSSTSSPSPTAQAQGKTKIQVTQPSVVPKLATKQNSPAASVAASTVSSSSPAAASSTIGVTTVSSSSVAASTVAAAAAPSSTVADAVTNNQDQTCSVTSGTLVSSCSAPVISSKVAPKGIQSVSLTAPLITSASSKKDSATSNTQDKSDVSTSHSPSSSSEASVTSGVAPAVIASTKTTVTSAQSTEALSKAPRQTNVRTITDQCSTSPTSTTTTSIITSDAAVKSSTVTNIASSTTTSKTPLSTISSSETSNTSLSSTISSSTTLAITKSANATVEKISTATDSKVTPLSTPSTMTNNSVSTTGFSNVNPTAKISSTSTVNRVPVTQVVSSAPSKEATSVHVKVEAPLTQSLLAASGSTPAASVTTSMASQESKPRALISNVHKGSPIGLQTPVTCGDSTAQQTTAAVTTSQAKLNGNMGPPQSASPANKTKPGTKMVWKPLYLFFYLNLQYVINKTKGSLFSVLHPSS